MDYRGINSRTTAIKYSLPRIDDTLESLAEMTLSSSLDAVNSFWQLKLHEKDLDKTAFSVMTSPNMPRFYEMKCLTQGIRNAPSVFQLTMEQILCDILGSKCLYAILMV